MWKRRLFIPAAAIALAFAACTDAPVAPDVDMEPQFGRAARTANIVDVANAALEAAGSEYRVAYAEYITDSSSGEMGNIIFASDRGNKQLLRDFIPNDPRRATFDLDGDPNTIDFFVYVTEGATSSGLSAATTTAAILRSTNTWDGAICSEMNPSFTPVGVDLGLVQFFIFGGSGFFAADIMHAGWLPGGFFDLVEAGGSGFILGVTFTFVFTSGDLDGDGLSDLAFREIYYNDAFSWADDGSSDIDVETVALHEAGHGLSQAHFGKIFGTLKNGKLHFSPRAVMNAAYSGVQSALTGTDDGGHCSIWADWPNN